MGPVPTQPRSLSGGRAQTEALCRPATEVHVRAGSPSSALGPPVAATCPGYPPLAVGTRAWGEAALPEFPTRERRKHRVRTAQRGFHPCAGCRGQAVVLLVARPLLTISSPPPFKGRGHGPRLSAGGASRNLWLCFSKIAFTCSETCSPVSFDKRSPTLPSRYRAVPAPEYSLVPLPGQCPPRGSPCSDFSLLVLQGDINGFITISTYTRSSLLTDPVFAHLPTC